MFIALPPFFSGFSTSGSLREWFKAHKNRYESEVREPALALIRAMQPELERIAPSFMAVDKKVGGSLMRVYRDVRFSKNKQPYKTNIGIQFRHKQGKDVHAPGFYLHIEAHEVFVGAGIWHPDAVTLKKIRAYMDTYPDIWLQARDEAAFAKVFSLTGDSLQRAPKGFSTDHPLIEDLKRKDFIAISPLMPELILQDDLVGLISSYLETSKPLMQYLCKAIGIPY